MSGFVRSRYGRYPVVEGPWGPSLTKQAERDETDINVIMKKYEKTGVLESWNSRPGRYADVSSVYEYMDALNIVQMAEESFANLPAEVRDACGNDPAGLLELVFDPERKAEAEALGLRLPGEEAPGAAASSPAPAGGASVIVPSSPAPAAPGAVPAGTTAGATSTA